MNNPITLTTFAITPEEFKAHLLSDGHKHVAWTIETYAIYVNLRYPHISVPLDQEWKNNYTKLRHVCNKHGEYLARPNLLLNSNQGCQCKGCKSDKQAASAGKIRSPRATPEEKAKAALMHSEGHTYSEISRILGRAHSTIRRWLDPAVKEKANRDNAQWRSNNHERQLANQRRWHNEFEHGRADNLARNATKRFQKQNTPEYVFIDNEWLEVDRRETWRVFSESLLPASERKAIQELYLEAQHLTEQTGVEHHVDHVQPLSKGGEHLMVNLQILTAQENLSKNNKFRPEDMQLLGQRYFNTDNDLHTLLWS